MVGCCSNVPLVGFWCVFKASRISNGDETGLLLCVCRCVVKIYISGKCLNSQMNTVIVKFSNKKKMLLCDLRKMPYRCKIELNTWMGGYRVCGR